MEFIGKLVSSIAIIAIATVVRGWAISVLWGWFIIPIFNSPVLSVGEGIGLSLMVSVFSVGNTAKREDSKSFALWIIQSGVASTISLGTFVLLAWIVAQMIGK